MTTEHDVSTAVESTTEPGPSVLAERSLLGIFVHLIGLATGIVGPGLVYLFSTHEYTRTNARNAFNWQLFVTLAWLAVLAPVLGWILLVEWTALPDPIVLGLFVVVAVAMLASTALTLLGVVFPLVATGKAIFGSAWEYPIAPDLVERLRSAGVDATVWWRFVAVYALVAPVVFVAVGWLATGGTLADGWLFGLLFVTLFLAILASVITPAALYRDAAALADEGATWRPNWRLYAGVPLGAGALTYLVASVSLGSENPAGDAVYGYMVAIWVTSVVYLYRRHGRIDA